MQAEMDGQFAIVIYRLKPDVNRDQFLEISARATEWLRNRPGYLGRELLEDGSGEWVDLVRWATMEDALAAASAFMETPEAAAREPLRRLLTSRRPVAAMAIPAAYMGTRSRGAGGT